MESDRIRTALITGASAGIGAEFARIFASRGFDLVLVARRLDRLEALAAEIKKEHGQLVQVISADLGDPAVPQQLFDSLQAQDIQIDALVNNAGYALNTGFLESDWNAHAQFLQVLNTSVVHLCYLFARPMKERGYGRILNVSSVAAFSPQLKGNLYGAAKSFILDFTQALDLELHEHQVYCTALCPGFTFSEFHDIMGVRGAVSRLPRFMWMDATSVAREGYDAVMAGRAVHINGLVNQGVSQVMSHLPLRLKNLIARKQAIF